MTTGKTDGLTAYVAGFCDVFAGFTLSFCEHIQRHRWYSPRRAGALRAAVGVHGAAVGTHRAAVRIHAGAARTLGGAAQRTAPL